MRRKNKESYKRLRIFRFLRSGHNLGILGLALPFLMLVSCQRKELPVPKYDRGTAMSGRIDLTGNYKNQVWYSLSGNQVVSTNLKKDWDIALESSPDGWHVILNAAKSMQAALSTKDVLTEIKDTSGYALAAKPDSPSGNLDSTALGDWRSHEHCYIINRGYDENARFQGFYKFKITSQTVDTLYFEYGDVYGKVNYKGKLGKTFGYAWVMYSFSSKKQLLIEPPQDSYDLCFSQYTTIFYDPFMYYQVTGVLSNAPHIGVIKLAERNFADVQLSDTLGHNFSYRNDAIGYDWKYYDLNTNVYTVYDKIVYIIKDQKGFYYKLHFIDFYNELGEKGYPTIEYMKL